MLKYSSDLAVGIKDNHHYMYYSSLAFSVVLSANSLLRIASLSALRSNYIRATWVCKSYLNTRWTLSNRPRNYLDSRNTIIQHDYTSRLT